VDVVTARSNRRYELDWRQVIASSEGAILSEIREIMTWEVFGVASRELAIQVAESGYEPDIILAIARGGLLSAGALGYALSVKNTYTMNVEFYTGVNERLAVPMILPPVPSLVDLKDSKVWKYTDEWINFPWSDKDPVAKRKWSVKDA